MILSDVKPTRMELLRLKKRIAIAHRGHKLLRDKQEELMRRFMGLINETRRLREEIEAATERIFTNFLRARALVPSGFLDRSISYGSKKIEIRTRRERMLNLSVPRIELVGMAEYPIYSLALTTGDLDTSFREFRALLPKLLRLAELELAIKLLAEEIKRTRRRVNALEYILIPNLADTAKYITMRLAELERSGLVRLMRVKELIASK
jgi:V/A-type H+-transporting ATPase subunit D